MGNHGFKFQVTTMPVVSIMWPHLANRMPGFDAQHMGVVEGFNREIWGLWGFAGIDVGAHET